MATKIRTISMSEEDDKLVDELHLSPSGLFKLKIEEIRMNQKFSVEKINELERSRDIWKENFRRAERFIESKGQWDEFNGIKKDVVQ